MIAFITLCIASALALLVAVVAGVALLLGVRVPPLVVAAAMGMPLAITHTVITRAIAQINANQGTVVGSMSQGLRAATEAAGLGAWVGVLTVVPALVFLLFAAVAGARRSPRHFTAPLFAVPLTLLATLIPIITAYFVEYSNVAAIATAGAAGLVGLLSGAAMLRGGDGNGKHAGAAAGIVAAISLCALSVARTQSEVLSTGALLSHAPADGLHNLFQSAAYFQLAWHNASIVTSVAAVGFVLLGASCMAGQGRGDRSQALLLAAVSVPVLLLVPPSTPVTHAIQASVSRARLRATPHWADDLRAPRIQERSYSDEARELVVLDKRALRFQGSDLVQLTGTPPTLPDAAIVDAAVKPLADALADVHEPLSLAVHAQTEGRALAAVALTMARDEPIRVYTSPADQILLYPAARTPMFAELTPSAIANIPCKPSPCSGESFPYDDWRTVLERGQRANPDERLVTIFVYPNVTAEAALAGAAVAAKMELQVSLVPRSP